MSAGFERELEITDFLACENIPDYDPAAAGSRGGQHAWENCVASCTICNHRKADRLLEELGWTLPVAPAVPRGAHWRLIGAQYDGDPQWEAYLGATSAA